MKGRHLHIISFNVPYPPDYGGVMDVYYKLKSLQDAGVKIHLHSYHYGRERMPELENVCHVVHYYPRLTLKNPFAGKLPYIVKTRNSSDLLNNLLKDEHPILFEGLHSCFYLNHEELKNRKRIVRMHNIEHLYYQNLARAETNPLRKYFFYTEAKRLRKFQNSLKHATGVAAISPEDHSILNIKFKNAFYLPVYHPNEAVMAEPGRGDYVLYHGNLGVAENNKAALYLVEHIFDKLEIPLVIAGMNPTPELKKAVSQYSHIDLHGNISSREIFTFIKNAHINILPTFQNTGIKLKLINVLYRGRHCIVTPKMVAGTGLEELCEVAEDGEQMQELITSYYNKKFDASEIARRKSILEDHFNKEKNTAKFLEKIYTS